MKILSCDKPVEIIRNLISSFLKTDPKQYIIGNETNYGNVIMNDSAYAPG